MYKARHHCFFHASSAYSVQEKHGGSILTTPLTRGIMASDTVANEGHRRNQQGFPAPIYVLHGVQS
jgi:hypothetical protein